MPPTSQRTFLTIGPRTMAANAEPTNRKPTTPFTPEQAETTLRAKVEPWWVITKRVLSRDPAGFARWVATAIFCMASKRERGEGVEDAEEHLLIRVRPCQEEEQHGQPLTPEDPGPEDDGHRPGHEDREGEQVDPVDPEHGGHAGREELVHGDGGHDERDADGVVDVPVVDRRLRLEGPRPDRRQGQGDGGDQADVGQRRLLVGGLQQRVQRVVVGNQHGAQQDHDLDAGAGALGGIGPSLSPAAPPVGDRRIGPRRAGTRAWRHSWLPPLGGLTAESPGTGESPEPPMHVVGGPWIARPLEQVQRSGRPRRCGPACPPRRPGRGHSCPTPVEPAACCG